TSSSQCLNGRACVQGYCVFESGDGGACPSQCTSCDVSRMTCTIVDVGAVSCPAGWNCVVQCSRSNTCATVACGDAASCQVTCSAANTCGQVQCGTTRCQVACDASTSCTSVACQSSCQCDVTCNGGNSCLTVQCPRANGGNFCTTDGKNGSPCSSSFASSCSSC